MFRNPRENRLLPDSKRLAPSTGRPPSPPSSRPRNRSMAAKSAPKVSPRASTNAPQKKKTIQTTLVSSELGKKSPVANGKHKQKPQSAPNGNIMAFFKKA